VKIQNLLVAASAPTACLTGCASAATRPVEQAARQFYANLEGRRAEQACALLAPEAAKSLEAGDQSCATAILRLGLAGGEVRGAEVWGDEAQVRLARDTVFPHRFPQGWLVRGAGCEPGEGLPYECEVEA
jgi:hypothetical protein